MLAVGLITGQLTAGLRFQARVAMHREERAGSLYEIARDLSGAVQIEQVVKISDESIERTFRAECDALAAAGRGRQIDDDAGRARRAADGRHRHCAVGVRQGPAGRFRHRYAAGQRGALHSAARADACARRAGGRANNRRLLRIPEQRQLLDTFAALIAIALERVHYVGVAQDALVRMESERLRNSCSRRCRTICARR
jgi:two-component system, OmpR family, sensor histidine kinase KdpD